MALFGLFGKKQESLLTPEAQRRGAALPTSRGGTPYKDPFAGLNKTNNRPAPTLNRSPSFKQIIDPKKAIDSGLFFSSDIAQSSLPKGKLSFQNGYFGTTTPSPLQGGQPTFKPIMSGTQIPGPTVKGLTPSSTKTSGETSGGLPVTSPAFTMEGGSETTAMEGEAGGEPGGSGTTAPGGGGYTPAGFSEMEEGVDTETPDPRTVSDQPFTQAPGGGALGAGSQSGTLTGAPVPSKFEQGFNNALATMGGGGAQGITGAQGSQAVNQYSPASSNTVASNFVKTDPYIDSLVKAWQDYISPQNQRKSLSDTYNQMLTDSGVQAIDTELLNMKSVIEGSEDDIRTEITKAGGFATNSQVLALTNARNKQLIKNYNTLLDTRNAKEKYLQTAIGLEQADRESADQRFESAFSMGTQIATLQNQMQTNARNQMQWLATNIGMDGLYEATGGDRFALDLVEQTLGIPRGGLYGAATQARQAKIQAQQEAQLDLQLKQSQLQTNVLQRENIRSEMKSRSIQDMIDMQKIGGGVSDEQRQLSSLDLVNTLDGVQTHKGFNNAVGPGFFKWFTRAATPGGAKQSFIGDVQNIVDNMSLDKLIKAKAEGATFGALSDNELRMLGSAATKIGTWAKKNKNGEVVGYNVSEKAFRGELDRISSLTKRAYILSGYQPQDVGAQVMDDGSIWVQNYDGSLTNIN